MNPLGKLPESTAVAGKMDFVGLMKVLRVALLAGGAAVLGVFITMLPGLDFLPESTIDTTIITLLLIPGLEAVRRWVVDYSATPIEG